MEIKNAADQDRAYKAEFPELPMQWKNYEIGRASCRERV